MYDPPVLTVTAGRRLFAATTGYITYRTGAWSLFGWGGDVSRKMDKSSVSLGMAGMNKNANYSGELQVSCCCLLPRFRDYFYYGLLTHLKKKRRVLCRRT